MDPYLETPGLWSDFHPRFITYWCDALIDCLPDNNEARIGEKVSLVDVSPPRRRLIEPDVAVTQREPSRGPSPAPAGLATLETATLSLVIAEETHERHIEVLHRPDRTLVAVLECQAYPWTLREARPPLPIPLLPPDPDVWIDLAALFRTAYERGHYRRSLDYSAPPPVALDPPRLAWVMDRVRGGTPA
jgi:hypothetical protein